MRLYNIFSLALGATFLTSFLVVAAFFYHGALQQAERETMREARILLTAASAARTYTSDHVTPLLTVPVAANFTPESVPSFATKTIMKGFNTGFPEYTYREAVLNPTNLDDLATTWESDIIQRFRSEPDLKEVFGERTKNNVDYVYIAQPLRVPDPACLDCHSVPSNAPSAMIAAYGPSHGFGWKLNETIGAKYIFVPKMERLGPALSNLFWFLISLGCIQLVAVLVATVVVQIAVVIPARRLADQARRLSVGEYGANELTAKGPVEFSTAAQAINRLHRSLALALKDAEDVRHAHKQEV